MSTTEHAEGFALMDYECGQGCCHELIWNSRDGVTPFIIRSKRGHEMQHVRWNVDRYAPKHKPYKGDRIFVDQTREMAREAARKYVDRWWGVNVGGTDMEATYGTKEAAVEKLAASWYGQYGEGTSPELITVEEDWQ